MGRTIQVFHYVPRKAEDWSNAIYANARGGQNPIPQWLFPSPANPVAPFDVESMAGYCGYPHEGPTGFTEWQCICAVPGMMYNYQTGFPTAAPSAHPATAAPTVGPTKVPTTAAPTATPTKLPTSVSPTAAPTRTPTTKSPTMTPTSTPSTASPTCAPYTSGRRLSTGRRLLTAAPTTAAPTDAPSTAAPSTVAPTKAPVTVAPTKAPSTVSPTNAPNTVSPTIYCA